MKKTEPGAELAIGELAERTGLAVSAIRYYEEVGLIAKAMRRPSGHRVYGRDAQTALTLIRRCRDFGFSVDETRELVALSTDDARDCVDARSLAQRHLAAVDAKLAQMRALRLSLVRFVGSCTDECAGGPAAQCTILKDLARADPRLASNVLESAHL